MSKALITEAYLTDIADAIRAKNGSSDTYTPPQMAAAIGAIPTGGDVTVEALSVTQNGTYTAPTGKAYSPVTVNVSGGGGSDLMAIGELMKYAVLSNTSNDRFTRNGRWFNRNSSEPVIVLGAAYITGTTIEYSGYGVICFSSAGLTGTYSEYGELANITKGTTPKGTDYWVTHMYGMWPPSADSGKLKIECGSSTRVIANEFVIDATKVILNCYTFDFVGDSDLIAALNDMIDAVYQEYYAS